MLLSNPYSGYFLLYSTIILLASLTFGACGSDDDEPKAEGYTVSTAPAAFQDVMTALEKAGIATVSAEVEYVPTATKPLSDLDQVKKLLSFVSALEDNEDVQNVYHDADIPDDVMEQAEGAE